jgi:predicted HicB family RNase H-like nuclease
MIEYKGYLGKVELDEEAGLFHGEVINVRDVITFEGKTVAEVREAFRDSIEDYLAFCAERGEDPERPFSGTFVVRTTPELHRELYTQARLADKSLNRWINEVLTQAAQYQVAIGTAKLPSKKPLGSRAGSKGRKLRNSPARS